jgi:hypothetical protein
MIHYGRIAARFMMLVPVGAGIAASCTVVPGVTSSTSGHATTTTATSSSGTGAAGGGSGGSDDAGPSDAGDPCRAQFESAVLPGLLTNCGGCHQVNGIADDPFLGGGGTDPYTAITSWPNVIVSDPMNSIILVHSNSATHGGGQAPHLDQFPALQTSVIAWLTCEAAHLPVVDSGSSPAIAPFLPRVNGAMNEVDLDPLGPGFAGSSITFVANTLPANAPNPTLLVLTELTVYPVENVSLTIVHPLFTIYGPDGSEIPDPADTFSDLDATYTAPAPLDTGTLILSQWQTGARLGIEFQAITATSTTPATENTCTDMADFIADVLPELTVTNPCAPMCHGGGNIMAQQQMDLSTIAAMPPDQACSQVRARITPGDPTTSQILIVTNPEMAVPHLYKFGGNLNAYNSFKAAVTPWINGEQ